MRGREIWFTKENTSDVLVTVPIHFLHLSQCICNEQTICNENSRINENSKRKKTLEHLNHHQIIQETNRQERIRDDIQKGKRKGDVGNGWFLTSREMER